MRIFSKKFNRLQLFLLFLFLFVVMMTSRHLWSSDVLFHTDVARDMLVLRDIVETKQPTLIGPRSSMPGIFHGPLWYYVCLLPFVLTGGDPVLMGWFWWLCGVMASILFLWVSYRLSKDLTASLLVTIAFALFALPGAAGPTNTFFANLFAFLPFYLWWLWLKKPRFLLAAGAWLSIGLLVQFQMGFAVLIAVVFLPIFLWKVFKEKIFVQLLSLFFFLPPLASFVLFDLRHDFLQVRSFFAYLKDAPPGPGLLDRFFERLEQSLFRGGNIFALPAWLNLLVMVIFAILVKKNKSKELKNIFILLAYLYFSWWFLTVAFSGVIWNFYFDPFVGMILLCLGFLASKSKKAKVILFVLVMIFVFRSRGSFSYHADRFDSSSWRLLSQIAAESLTEQNGGYFLYSQDQFAYPLKYAFAFYLKKHPGINASAFEKKSTTVLVKAEDDPGNPWSTAEGWQRDKLRINLSPYFVKNYPHGYLMEKYQLDQETLTSGVDPNLVKGLEFR